MGLVGQGGVGLIGFGCWEGWIRFRWGWVAWIPWLDGIDGRIRRFRRGWLGKVKLG